MNKYNQQIQIRYIIVPNCIIEDSSIQDGEKLLFGEIASHSLEKGYCWFSNKHLTKRFHISDRTASRWVNDLKQKGYITIEIKHRQGSKEIEERQIRVNTLNPFLAEYMRWYRHQWLRGMDKIDNSPIAINGVDNNKGMNNKVLINLKDISNVLLSEDEYHSLVQHFGKQKTERTISEFSVWKDKTRAKPKSDFDSLTKWLSKISSKRLLSSISETGADVVTDEMLSNLPF